MVPIRDLVRITGPRMEPARYYSLELWLTDTFGPDSQGLRVVNATADVSQAVRRAALCGLAVDILRCIRDQYPNLAVVFRDKNNDSDTDFGVDIQTLRRLTDVVTIESGAFGSRSRPKPCSVAVLDLMDPFGLERGLIETVPPCEYVYVASEQGIDREAIVAAVKEATDEDDLIRRLVETYPVVLVPGADNDYINILTFDPRVYSRCGLLEAPAR